jgi:hypothetical protein
MAAVCPLERFCLTAGIGAIEQMLCEDVQQLAGAPHNRGGGRVGHRWGRAKGKIGFHGGKVAVHRPRESSVESSYGGKIITGQFWTFTTQSAKRRHSTPGSALRHPFRVNAD